MNDFDKSAATLDNIRKVSFFDGELGLLNQPNCPIWRTLIDEYDEPIEHPWFESITQSFVVTLKNDVSFQTHDINIHNSWRVCPFRLKEFYDSELKDQEVEDAYLTIKNVIEGS